MFIRNSKRFNIWASQIINDVRYPHFRDPALRVQLGITEIADPVRESEETHYVQEIDDAPYVINTPKPQDVIDKQNAEKARQIADEAATTYAKAAPVITYLATHTPQECEAYVAANVTDLASAKGLLGKFAIALCVLARREFKPDPPEQPV